MKDQEGKPRDYVETMTEAMRSALNTNKKLHAENQKLQARVQALRDGYMKIKELMLSSDYSGFFDEAFIDSLLAQDAEALTKLKEPK